MLHMPIFVQIIAAISKRNVYNDVQIKVSFVTKFKEYVQRLAHNPVIINFINKSRKKRAKRNVSN